MRILIIEDEKRIANFIEKGLQAEGYSTHVANDGETGSYLAISENFDLIILDIMLPIKDGFTVLSEVRNKKPELAIIILTAKDDLNSKIKGLDLGADDYLIKPFAFEELTARIRAKIRINQANSTTLTFEGFVLDLKTRELSFNEKKVFLPSKEFSLLEFLMRHPNQILSRVQILNQVWDYNFDPESNIVDVYIKYLREKIKQISDKDLIFTIRGAGYRVAKN